VRYTPFPLFHPSKLNLVVPGSIISGRTTSLWSNRNRMGRVRHYNQDFLRPRSFRETFNLQPPPQTSPMADRPYPLRSTFPHSKPQRRTPFTTSYRPSAARSTNSHHLSRPFLAIRRNHFQRTYRTFLHDLVIEPSNSFTLEQSVPGSIDEPVEWRRECRRVFERDGEEGIWTFGRRTSEDG